MSLLLVLCIGAVSAAADLEVADVNDNNVNSVLITDVSDDMGGVNVLSEGGDDSGESGEGTNPAQNSSGDALNQHNLTIEVPNSTYVDLENPKVSFNITVKDVDETIDINKTCLIINVVYIGEVIEMSYDAESAETQTPKNVTQTIQIVPEDFNLTDNKQIDFILPEDVVKNFNNSNISLVYYHIVSETEFETQDPEYYMANATIALKQLPYYMSIQNKTNVNIHSKDVEFEINITTGDDPENRIVFTKDDLNLILHYIETINNTDNETNETNITEIIHNLTVTNFTVENVTKYWNNTDNETNETTQVPYTVLVVKFNVEGTDWGSLIGNFNWTNATLELVFRNNTTNQMKSNVTLFPTVNATIVVNDAESSTIYHNTTIVVYLIDEYDNKSLASQGLKFQFKNSTMPSVNWGISDENNEKISFNADYYYSLGGFAIPVGQLYEIIVTPYDNIIATSKNVTFNVTKDNATLNASKYTAYYGSGEQLSINLTSKSTGEKLSNVKLKLTVYFTAKSNQKFYVYTNANGTANVNIQLSNGTYKVSIDDGEGNLNIKQLNITVTVKPIKNAKITASKTTAYYASGSVFKVKMVAKNGTALKGASVLLNIYTGKKFKAVMLVTNDNGIATWNVTGISIGTHKVLVGSGSTGATANIVSTSIILKKCPTTVVAKNVTNKYKASSYFNITVTKTKTKKVVSGLKLKIKVYTGKKYKTYYVTTNSKGVAKFNTKVLSKGTHKVVISSANTKYTVSKSSSIRIK